MPRIPWLEQAQWALLSVVLVYVWHRLGFTFIVFSGGLGNLPKEVLEAADVDGATGWRRLWYIVFIAPEKDQPRVESTFKQMLDSVNFGQ